MGLFRATVLTLNIWQEQGPWAERIELCGRRLQQLAPDIICLQEVRQVPEKIPNQAATLAEKLGMHHVYETAQPWGGGDEGLAILSRFPIVESDCRELPYFEGRSRRVCLGAALQSPGGPVWVFTTHLAFRLEDGLLREQQIVAASAFVEAHRNEQASMLCGDFNATPDSDEMRYLRGLATLQADSGPKRTYYQDAFAVCNPTVAGHTWTAENPYTDQLSWFPSRRLDYILVTPQRSNGVGRIHKSRVVCTEADERGVRCSDHYGVLAEIDVAQVIRASDALRHSSCL